MKTGLLYVLDLDDTLVLERDYVRSGFNAVERWLAVNTDLKTFVAPAWRLFEQGARGTIFNQVLEQAGCYSADLVDQLVHVYRHHIPRIALLPDAEAFLKAHGRDDLALITDGYPETQQRKIEALGLSRFIGTIIITGKWGRPFWKPHERAFLKAAGGRRASECVYIGDNPQKDFTAPRALEWAPSIRIRRRGSLHRELPTPSWCREIESFEDFQS